MANWYVWSGATGAATGADWANAYTRLRLATAAKAAGDVFFVAHDHSETEALAHVITSPGTEANPCQIYCVNRAGSVPPVSADLRTTAIIANTGANNISLSGSVSECYGIIFNCGSAGSTVTLQVAATAGRTWRLVGCHLRLNSTSNTSRIGLGANTSACFLENCTLQFGAVAQSIAPSGRIVIRNTAASFIPTGSVPTALFTPASGGGTSEMLVEGVNLSAVVTAKTLFSVTTNNTLMRATFKDCRLGTGASIVTGTFLQPVSLDLALIRCDGGDTNYRVERHNYYGSQTTETTIVRTGGASDGTTPIACKIVTSANSKLGTPFESLPISIWNETTGSAMNVRVEGIWDAGVVPLTDEIWIECQYLGTSGFPVASKATSSKADALAAGADIPPGSGTWGGSTTKFAMSVNITPQERGPVTIYVRAAKVSSTFYIDPKPVVTMI